MSDKLNEIEVRILGALVEKQLTTPEYYPLTLNALVAACNQKTNREPVTAYAETEIQNTLDILREEKNLVYVFYGSTSRVPKYKHILPQRFELDEPETAVMCVLMLRSAQTIAEIRERTGRLYEFSGLNEVQETLDALMKKEEPLIVRLERLAGQKEARYAHLLSGEVKAESFVSKAIATNINAENERIGKLENELENLRSEFNLFRQSFEEFKKQFE